LRPAFFEGDVLLSRFLAPPVSLFTVAQAMRSAVLVLFPEDFALSSMCWAWRFCFELYLLLLPRGIKPPILKYSNSYANRDRSFAAIYF
jgi:hypothetical protein